MKCKKNQPNLWNIVVLCVSAIALEAMEQKNTDIVSIKPTITFDLFSADKDLAEDGKWAHRVQNSNVVVAPHGTHIIASASGSVYLLELKKESSWDLIFGHKEIKHATIIATSQPQKYSPLVIASAGNVFNDRDHRWISSFIVYCDDRLTMKHFRYPIQNVKFSGSGDKIIIGGQSSLVNYDWKENKLEKLIVPLNDRIIDIAISYDGLDILTINEKGVISVYTPIHNSDMVYSPTRYVPTGLLVKSIELYQNNELFLRCAKGAVYHINAKKLMNTGRSTEKPSPIVSMIKNKNSTLNAGWTSSSALWSKKSSKHKEQNVHNIISIFMFNHFTESIDEIFLKAPMSKKNYAMLSNKGTLKLKDEKILTISLHGKYVVAFNNRGKVFFWQLPIKDSMPKPIVVTEKSDDTAQTSTGSLTTTTSLQTTTTSLQTTTTTTSVTSTETARTQVKSSSDSSTPREKKSPRKNMRLIKSTSLPSSKKNKKQDEQTDQSAGIKKTHSSSLQ